MTMLEYHEDFIKLETFIKNQRQPDFNNLLKVLKKQKTECPVIFELFINVSVIEMLTSHIKYNENDPFLLFKRTIDAYRITGNDFAVINGSDFRFHLKDPGEMPGMRTSSLNRLPTIFDRDSFNSYNWEDPGTYDYSRLEKLSDYLPEGMKIVTRAPDGLLETVIKMTGFDNMCFMLADEPDLLREIFDAVGSRYLKFYEMCVGYDAVGALVHDDDWGYKTQTIISVNDLRKYVVPWHRKYAEVAHDSGKPIILHSCGNLEAVTDDIIYDIKYDGKQSYEDNILPVEKAYEELCGKIAVLGGIDVDFLSRSTPEKIYNRSCDILEQTKDRGGYALGSGNSIPEYIPLKNYLAMIAAALFN